MQPLKIMPEETLEWVVIGRFGRPHGLKGFVTVNSFTRPRENIMNYAKWHVQRSARAKSKDSNNTWQALKILQIETSGKQILAQIDGYSDRDQCAELTNLDIAVLKEQLPVLNAGEYYWHQLIGMTVVNASGATFGKVTEIFATGSNDVLVVQGENRHLIPFLLDDVILSINELERMIVADWDINF